MEDEGAAEIVWEDSVGMEEVVVGRGGGRSVGPSPRVTRAVMVVEGRVRIWVTTRCWWSGGSGGRMGVGIVVVMVLSVVG